MFSLGSVCWPNLSIATSLGVISAMCLADGMSSLPIITFISEMNLSSSPFLVSESS